MKTTLDANEFRDFVTEQLAKFTKFASNDNLAGIEMHMPEWLERFAKWLEAGGPSS